MRAVRKAARVPPPRRFKGVLDAALFDSFQLYVRALAASGRMRWEDWGRRHVRNDDPFAGLVHRELTPRVQAALRRAVKPSYSFLACYGEEGTLPAHRDREQCRYTFDLCLENGPARPWPLYVAGRAYPMKANEGLLYHGCELTHSRRGRPSAAVHIALFHFVDADFEGELS